jgi:hypothetical protein
MSVGVDVDLGSAVISYRPAAGEERSLPTQRVSSAALFDGVPWRMFRWYFGQRHYSGTWWSATMRDHVIYESRLELSRLLLADFDPDVRRIAAQPFMLTTSRACHRNVNRTLRRRAGPVLFSAGCRPGGLS